jgi:hypothetical protein
LPVSPPSETKNDTSRIRQFSRTHQPNHTFLHESGLSSEPRRRSVSTPAISNTLAVIKAQAFGALRRNRGARRRGNGHATKVALEALEARGLGLGLEPTNTLSSLHRMSDAIDDVDDSLGEGETKDEDMSSF